MASLAAFAQSDRGRLYSLVCERFNVDPAAGMVDDVIAHNLRTALFVELNRASQEPEVVMERTEMGTRVSGLDPMAG